MLGDTPDVDSWTTDVGGITWQVDLWRDRLYNDSAQLIADGTAADHEMTAADLAAYDRVDWLFVTVVFRPVIGGAPVEQARVSLNGFGYGTCPGWEAVVDREYVTTNYPGPELMADARECLARFRVKLDALNLEPPAGDCDDCQTTGGCRCNSGNR